MKKLKLIVLTSLMALFFTACGSSSSSDGGSTTPAPPIVEKIDISNYFWGQLYTDDNEGNFHQVRYEDSTKITSPNDSGDNGHFYIAMHVNADGTASVYDNRFPVNARHFSFPHPAEIDISYTSDDGGYVVNVGREGNNIAIGIRLYDGSVLHTEAQYYLGENLGLYKRIFNGEILKD